MNSFNMAAIKYDDGSWAYPGVPQRVVVDMPEPMAAMWFSLRELARCAERVSSSRDFVTYNERMAAADKAMADLLAKAAACIKVVDKKMAAVVLLLDTDSIFSCPSASDSVRAAMRIVAAQIKDIILDLAVRSRVGFSAENWLGLASVRAELEACRAARPVLVNMVKDEGEDGWSGRKEEGPSAAKRRRTVAC